LELSLAARGQVRVVTKTYRLDEIGKACERVEKGQVRLRAAAPEPPGRLPRRRLSVLRFP
jgi:hypothetical protein